VLFKIDPTPYDAQVKAIEAQLKLSATRLSQMTQLYERDAGRAFDVEQRSVRGRISSRASLKARSGTLTRLSCGRRQTAYVTNLALRKGARVQNLPLSPVMAFIDTPTPSSASRSNQVDRPLYRARTSRRNHFQIRAGTKSTPAGSKASFRRSQAVRRRHPAPPSRRRDRNRSFVVRVKLDDAEFAQRLPAGSTGTAAVFTDHVKISHIIRRVLLRQVAISIYVNPF